MRNIKLETGLVTVSTNQVVIRLARKYAPKNSLQKLVLEKFGYLEHLLVDSMEKAETMVNDALRTAHEECKTRCTPLEFTKRHSYVPEPENPTYKTFNIDDVLVCKILILRTTLASTAEPFFRGAMEEMEAEIHRVADSVKAPSSPYLIQPSGFLERLSHEFEAIQKSALSPEKFTNAIGRLRERGAGTMITDDFHPKPIPFHFNRPLIDDTQEDIKRVKDYAKNAGMVVIDNVDAETDQQEYREKMLKLASESMIMVEPLEPFLNWIFTEDVTPDSGFPVLGFHPEWIDEDFAPSGIRECIFDYDGNGNWMYVKWCNQHEEYHTRTIEEPGAAGYIPPHQWLDYSNILPERP